MNTKNSLNDFAFIIPTLSNREGLNNVLEKLKKYYPGGRVVIVNNSSDELKLDAEVINEGRNTGFAKAVNDGAKKARDSKYLVFLNDDIDFDSDWVDPVIEEMENKKWSAASPRLVNEKGEVENLGYWVLPYGKVRLNKERIDLTVDGLSATALVFDSVDFFKLGGFDEKFFAYLEDVDLFLRAKKEGLKYGAVDKVAVIHEGQTTSNKFKTKKAYLDFRNWIRVISKNWSSQDLRNYRFQILIERGRNFFGIIKSLF